MEMPRHQPRPSPKRDAVLDAAQACFLELGFAATSMDLVAAGAGVSKATIYAHFVGKEDLFSAVIHRRCGGDLWAAEAWPLEGGARVTLTAAATRLMELMTAPDTLAMYRVVIAEAARQPDLARAFWEAGPGQGKARLSAVFEELSRRGDLDTPDPWAAADQFAGMLRAEIFHRTLLGLPSPEGRSAEATIAAAVETILRAYGRKGV